MAHKRPTTEYARRILIRRAAQRLPTLRLRVLRIAPAELPDRSKYEVPDYLCRSVVGQQLSAAAAGTIWRRLQEAAAAVGLSVSQFSLTRPPPELRAYGVSGNKARALRAVAEAHEAGLLCRKDLARIGHERRSAHLQQIWGVGQWTCDMMSIFYFREHDVWPESDTSANNTLRRLMDADGVSGDTAEMANFFQPVRSHLALYMWRIADSKD